MSVPRFPSWLKVPFRLNLGTLGYHAPINGSTYIRLSVSVFRSDLQLCYIRHEKPLVWKDGTELAMNVGFDDIVIEPLECDDINILAEYGEGTNFYLLSDLKGGF